MLVFWDGPSAFATAIGLALMFGPNYTVHVAAVIAFAFADVCAIIGGIVWMYALPKWSLSAFVCAGTTGIFAFVIAPSLMWLAFPATAQTLPSVSGTCNAVGNNNSNCSPYIVNPGRTTLTPQLEKELLAKIPKRKPGRIVVIGQAAADQNVGTQIFEFLKVNGYDMSSGLSRVGVSIPMPDRPLTFEDLPSSKVWTLVVAPSAH